jgi:hypothetical protein
VGFEPTISAFQRAKTVHALGREATVIGNRNRTDHKEDITEINEVVHERGISEYELNTSTQKHE